VVEPLSIEANDATADAIGWVDAAGDQGLRESRKRLLSDLFRLVPKGEVVHGMDEMIEVAKARRWS